MTRAQIIQLLIDFGKYQRYLEIGMYDGVNFRQINIPHKVSIDPDRNCFPTYVMTSDQFFSHNTDQFDIIFVDGLHLERQVEQDILNSLDCLADNGTIVAHDLIPRSYEAQEIPRKIKQWNGDCWKAWVKLRTERDDLMMVVINCDEGMGIIRRGEQDRLKLRKKELKYEDFCEHKEEWLNLKPTAWFMGFLKEIAECPQDT